MDESYMKKIQRGDIFCPKIHDIEERRRIYKLACTAKFAVKL
jgi:hypothetical protein